jgi:hypothetical protein
MKQIEAVNFRGFENRGQKATDWTVRDFNLGKTNLQVRLASDMDYGFLERLGRILNSENPNSKNQKS